MRDDEILGGMFALYQATEKELEAIKLQKASLERTIEAFKVEIRESRVDAVKSQQGAIQAVLERIERDAEAKSDNAFKRISTAVEEIENAATRIKTAAVRVEDASYDTVTIPTWTLWTFAGMFMVFLILITVMFVLG